MISHCCLVLVFSMFINMLDIILFVEFLLLLVITNLREFAI